VFLSSAYIPSPRILHLRLLPLSSCTLPRQSSSTWRQLLAARRTYGHGQWSWDIVGPDGNGMPPNAYTCMMGKMSVFRRHVWTTVYIVIMDRSKSCIIVSPTTVLHTGIMYRTSMGSSHPLPYLTPSNLNTNVHYCGLHSTSFLQQNQQYVTHSVAMAPHLLLRLQPTAH
jgi:hypothetical protein